MKIYSKKSFKFKDPNNEQAPVVVQTMAFATVPDWVENSLMFKLASQDGDITIIENRVQEVEAEKEAGADPALKVLRAQAKKLGITGVNKMDSEELTAAIEEAQKGEGKSLDDPNKGAE